MASYALKLYHVIMTPKSRYLGLRGHALRSAQIIAVVAPAFTLFGYNQAGVGPLANLDSWGESFPQIKTIHDGGSLAALHSTRKGAVIASFQVGALFGALSCLFLGDRFGRRRTIFLAAALTAIGSILQGTSFNIIQFVVGRVILGFGVGEISVAVPVWQSECSSAAHRGRDVIAAGIFMCLGYALCNWLDLAFSFVPHSSLQWRLPLLVSLVLSATVLASIFFLPESPRWLVRMNRNSLATINLAALKGLPEDHEAVRTEIAQIESELEFAATRNNSLSEMFSKDDEEKLFYRFCLCFALQFFQQACGGTLISVYASTIFQENLGLDTLLSRVLAASALTWKFLCCFLAFFAIDRLGRRSVFMISGAGMSVCMAVLAISTSFGQANYSASITSVTFIFLFNVFYPFGFLGGNFLYCTEVAPARLRVAMNSISTANHWLWNFAVTMVTPVAIETIGYRYYIIYAITSALIPIVVFFFYPETMNRNLELLNNVFKDASSPWEIVSMAKNLPEGEIADDSHLESEKTIVEQKELV
ncbi:putative hexose carrier protein [Rosellinia necatrix]|uniref:Putative hexose carrier protein n=1 Tax=Rosellinia necatrix TaxID=77044 RepID=A0A1W2TUE6_ROSNE|nr:putative hexose carrier protein [Rosellinia necatrix]